MSFSVKDWVDGPGLVLLDANGHYWRIDVSTGGVISTTDLGTSAPSSTPLSAVAIEDLEDRLSDYTDLVVPGTLLWSDDFSTDQLTTAYTAESGVAVSGGVLNVPSGFGVDTHVKKNTLAPGTSLQQIKALTAGSVAAATGIRLIANYIDHNNYVMSQYEFNSRNITMYVKSGGSFTLITSRLAIEGAPGSGVNRWVRLLYQPGGTLAFSVHSSDPESDFFSGFISACMVMPNSPTTPVTLTGAQMARVAALSGPKQVGFEVNFPTAGWQADDYKVWKA